MTLLSKPPNLQQVAKGINDVVAPIQRVPIAADIEAVLAFTLTADQILRRIFWSVDQFTMTGVNTALLWDWPTVPQNETRRYLHVTINEPRVKPNVSLQVIYPAQGVLSELVGMTLATADADDALVDFLSPGQKPSKEAYPGLPVDVFPSGKLRGFVNNALAVGDTVKVFSVWERLPPPNTARAEFEALAFLEA